MNLKYCISVVMLIMFFYSTTSGQSYLYLGQTPPTSFAKRFAPTNYLATSSWFWHGAPCFSPDGNEMYFVKYFTSTNKTQIWYSRYSNNAWSAPKVAPFATSQYTTNNPYFRNSNDTLYFQSNKPGAFIYYVTRVDTSWSIPHQVIVPVANDMIPGFQFSISDYGTIYFELSKVNTNNTDIYYSKCINGVYQEAVGLGENINKENYDWCPYISADEKVLYFSSNRTGGFGYNDMYVSIKNENGIWQEPINLTVRINGTFEDAYPYISDDGKYFFFTTAKGTDLGYNPYWISMDYINSLFTNIEDDDNIKLNFNLEQNFPNPFNPSTIINFNLPTSEYVSLKVYDLLGNEVTTLYQEKLESGNYSKSFDAKGLSSGIYFYKLQVGKISETKKMILLR